MNKAASDSSLPVRVAIAAEPLCGSGGLANYLACLLSAMASQRRHNEIALVESHAVPREPGASSKRLRRLVGEGTLKKILKPLYRKVVKANPYPAARGWAETWRTMPAETVCLLPHVVCNDYGDLDPYYAALAEHRLVWVVHDLHPLHFPEQWESAAVRTFRERCLTLSRKAHRIICHNQYTKDDVCSRLDVAPARVVVAHLPSILPSPASMSTSPDADLARLGIQRPYALWASSSTFAHKNHDLLFSAWTSLRQAGDMIQLVCTGSKAPRWRELETLIRSLRLEKDIVFTGSVDRSTLWTVLANAHLAVCPTLFEGGGSGPVTEAIMSQVPVACSRIPQIQEQLDFRDDLCEWFDPTNAADIAAAVRRILHSYEGAKQVAARAAETYPTLRSWENVARIYWSTLTGEIGGDRV